MAKWADFVITKVKYDEDETQIAEVESRADTGDAIGSDASRVARQVVVAAIARGTTYATALLRDGKWHKGEDVRVVTIHGERFLRTDNNATKADNLGSLPRYQ
jgi:hypothetical protein